jgi:hypothetical protein
MLSARRTGVTTTVVIDSVSGICALKRPYSGMVIVVDGWQRMSG